MKLSKLGRSTEKRVKLEDCINMFTSDEVLSGENAWDCPRCGPTASVSTSVSALENEPSIVKSKKKKSRFLHYIQEPSVVISTFWRRYY